MNYYVLHLRNETSDFGAYSPEEMQKLLSDFDRWNASMIDQGQLLISASLQGGGGKTLRAGNVVADGPYSEAKEAVTGLLLIRANDDAQAGEIASGCPFLPRGGSVEVRPVSELDFEDAALSIVEAHARTRRERLGREG